MFTGIIEATGEVREAIPEGGGVRLTIAAPPLPLSRADSIAVDGVCLTVISTRRAHPRSRRVRRPRGPSGLANFSAHDSPGPAFQFVTQVSPETLRVTTLGDRRRGDRVNLERPLCFDGRIGGHFVQGHVDGVGRIAAIVDEGSFERVTIWFPAALAPYMVVKGAVAVDGISLTIAALGAETFDVQIVPYTRDVTNLRAARPGKPVNLECDLIGKYVVRLRELAEVPGGPRPDRSGM